MDVVPLRVYKLAASWSALSARLVSHETLTLRCCLRQSCYSAAATQFVGQSMGHLVRKGRMKETSGVRRRSTVLYVVNLQAQQFLVTHLKSLT